MPAQAWESEESGVMASSRHAPCASALLALLGAVFLCSLQAIDSYVHRIYALQRQPCQASPPPPPPPPLLLPLPSLYRCRMTGLHNL